MNREEFAADKSIDPGQLDVEAVRQADVFFKWAERAVEAKALADRCKLKLELLLVRLEMQCRTAPEDFGLTKTSEAAVAAVVKAHPDYEKSSIEYINARRDAAILSEAVNAMQQKKSMLEEMIKLHGQQYFAGPSVPRDIISAWKEHQDRIEHEVNDPNNERVRHRKRPHDAGAREERRKAR